MRDLTTLSLSQEKTNSKTEVWVLPNVYHFCTIIKPKSYKSKPFLSQGLSVLKQFAIMQGKKKGKKNVFRITIFYASTQEP